MVKAEPIGPGGGLDVGTRRGKNQRLTGLRCLLMGWRRQSRSGEGIPESEQTDVEMT